MKQILLILLLSSPVFAQTQKEKDFIKTKSNSVEVEALKVSLEAMSLKNKNDIKSYLTRNPEMKNIPNLQRIDNGVPIFYQEDSNALCVQTLKANAMYPGGSLGLSVTGLGMTIGMWDGARVRETHVEFAGGRIIFGDAVAGLSTHATHVLGTMMASGVSPIRRGFAYQANAITYDFNNDFAEFSTFASLGNLVSNHSYGYISTNLPESTFGAYDSQAAQVDNVLYTFPFYQMVKSAGNDRSDTSLAQVGNKAGYDLLTGMSNSKNIITVAAVQGISTNGTDNSFVMSSFSNYGPTDDGRIKPDLAAKGVAVSSSISVSDNAYSELQGTSMSAPCITGLITLLQKHYNNLNPGTFMRASTVRGLLIQSAREAGAFEGPDYEFGWGLPDGELAARIISNRNVSSLLDENTLTNGQVFTKNITISTAQNINVAIAWTDRPGIANSGTVDNRSPRLINNLDLKVLKDGVVYYPWKLDPDAADAAATKTTDNNVDNVERVNITNALPGVYTIQVSHKGTLVDGSQTYSLIANGSGSGLGTDSRDFESSVFIYPNPTTTNLNFELKDNVEISSVSINDISGKLIFQTENTVNKSIDVSNLSAGVYFVSFNSGKNTSVKKFIKK